jgi:hypothetical protein
VLKGFGLGAAHTEFIKNSEDGEIYFLKHHLELVAHLAEMVEAASNINLGKNGPQSKTLSERKNTACQK